MTKSLSKFEPTTMDELDAFSKRVAKSTMIPNNFRNKPDDVFTAIVAGAELGLSAFTSLRKIAVIHGNPSIWGDALPAIVYAHNKANVIDEWIDIESKTAHCKITRADTREAQEKAGLKYKPIERTFSMDQANEAGLAEGMAWKKYPRRMVQMRARAFAIRDAFPDLLSGMYTAEEQESIPQERVKEADEVFDESEFSEIDAEFADETSLIKSIPQEPIKDELHGKPEILVEPDLNEREVTVTPIEHIQNMDKPSEEVDELSQLF